MTVNAVTVIDRLHQAASKAADDEVSNMISKLANRLAHQGSLFEKPLTDREIFLIGKFAGLEA